MAYYTIYLVFLNVLFWSALEVHFVSATGGCPGLEEICRNWTNESKLEDIYEQFGDRCPESMYLELLHPDICLHLPVPEPTEVAVTFSKEPTNQTREINETARFRCVTTPKARNTSWYLNEVYINVDDTQMKGKVSMKNNGERLDIHGSAGGEFYGKYRCEVVLAEGIVSRSAWLIDPESDSPICTLDFAVKPEKKIFLYSQEHHLLKCGAKYGEGGVSIKWYKKTGDSKIDVSKSTERHRPLMLQRGHLFIASARRVHRGEYICEIKDQTGCVRSTSVNIEVYTYVNEICGTAVNNPNYPNAIPGRSEIALEGSAPWQVSLQYQKKNGHRCGGIIINRYWILTAAHCLLPLNEDRLTSHNSVLKAGSQNLFTSVDHIQMRYIRRPRIYPKYKRTNYDFDIALIKLKTPLKLNDYVRPICLPIGQDNIANFTQNGDLGIVTGWGGISEELMQATVPIKSCEQPLPAMFCAGGGVNSACIRDSASGGPLIVPIPIPGSQAVKWFLAGVISHGPLCQVDSKYTNVADKSVLNWIISQTLGLGKEM